jgi:transposase-like protein
MKIRRTYTREFKLQIVRECENSKAMAQLSRQYGIHSSLITRWKKEYKDDPENAFSGKGNMYLYWGDGVTGTGLYGGVRFDDSLAETPSEPTQFVATVGVPFHAAICWDINGIDSTDEKVRVYRDGVVVGSTTTPWNPGGTDLEDNFKLGMNPDAQGFDKFISDNIIVWNYAKTNFSDRFNETPSTFECVTTDADGSFDPIEIWAIPSDANPNADAFDIVADKLDDDPNTGKYQCSIR